MYVIRYKKASIHCRMPDYVLNILKYIYYGIMIDVGIFIVFYTTLLATVIDVFVS